MIISFILYLCTCTFSIANEIMRLSWFAGVNYIEQGFSIYVLRLMWHALIVIRKNIGVMACLLWLILILQEKC